MRFAALLRGVNLGSARKVPMVDLRRVLEEGGFREVATYIQSGNVVFESDDDTDLRPRLESLIGDRFGMEVGVVVVSAPRMTQVIESCPYPTAASDDPAKVHVTFLDPALSPGALDGVDRGQFFPDVFEIGPGVVYLHLPNGMGRSKLPGALGRATQEVLATTRNWRTVARLNEMLSA